jgi:hypothetical protein
VAPSSVMFIPNFVNVGSGGHTAWSSHKLMNKKCPMIQMLHFL